MTSPATPRDRPVLGKDLITVQSRLPCSAQDCCCLLGIPLSTWSAWKRRLDDPVPSVTVALAIRLYDQYLELAVRHPTPKELHALRPAKPPEGTPCARRLAACAKRAGA